MAGTYVFMWQAMTKHSGNNFCGLFLIRNGARLHEAYADTNGMTNSGVDSSSNTAVLDLSKGDTVGIKTSLCYYLFGYPYTSFSGFKI